MTAINDAAWIVGQLNTMSFSNDRFGFAPCEKLEDDKIAFTDRISHKTIVLTCEAFTQDRYSLFTFLFFNFLGDFQYD